jgi:hypothetical protein
MRRKYLLIAGIVWLVLFLFGLYIYFKPHSSVAHTSPDLKIEAVELYNQFQQDEVAANKKYLDKVIEVKGRVNEVQHNSSGTSIQLDAGPNAGGINCSFTGSESGIPLPSKGSLITIKGRCSGYLMDVNLVDCALVQ